MRRAGWTAGTLSAVMLLAGVGGIAHAATEQIDKADASGAFPPWAVIAVTGALVIAWLDARYATRRDVHQFRNEVNQHVMNEDAHKAVRFAAQIASLKTEVTSHHSHVDAALMQIFSKLDELQRNRRTGS